MAIQQIALAQRITSAPTGDWGVTSFALDGSLVGLADRLGWTFTMTGSDKAFNRLRVISAVSGVTQRVIVHRNSDSAIMAQADISAPTADAWASAAVTSFTLLSGVGYTVSARTISGSGTIIRRNNTVTLASFVSSASSVFGSGDSRPSSASGNVYRYCDFGAE